MTRFRTLGVLLTFLILAPPAEALADSKPVDTQTFNTFRLFYEYDREFPLAPEIKFQKDIAAEGGVPVHNRSDLTFANNRDERVPAMLWLPRGGKSPYPCVLFLHGLGGAKLIGASFAHELLKAGFATMALDAVYHGERSANRPMIYKTAFYRLRDSTIQTVIDYRRAIDYLETRPEIDSKRISLIGVSMGAMMGAILAAVDTRVQCPMLLVGGADRGLVGRLSEHTPWKQLRKENPKVNFDEVSRVLAPADPLNFVDKISPRPVLMINGKADDYMPAQASKLLHETAKEPKMVLWMESGHALPTQEVLAVLMQWLKEMLAVPQ